MDHTSVRVTKTISSHWKHQSSRNQLTNRQNVSTTEILCMIKMVLIVNENETFQQTFLYKFSDLSFYYNLVGKRMNVQCIVNYMLVRLAVKSKSVRVTC